MTKKLISGSCLFLVTILLLQVYQELVLLPRQTVTYQISMISYFLMFFGVELFYVCLGFLMTTMSSVSIWNVKCTGVLVYGWGLSR